MAVTTPDASAQLGAPGLSLEASPSAAPAKRTRSGYQHPLIEGSDYERIYETKIRAIKRWRSIGIAANPPESPPLDDHVAMVDWWQRHMAQRVPERMLALRELALRKPTPPTPPAAAAPIPPPSDPADAKPARATVLDFSTGEGMDIAAAVRRQQLVLEVLQRDYEKSLCDPETDESALTLRANRVDKCLERLRKLETTLLDAQRSRGDLVPRAELRNELAPLLERFAGSLVTELVDRLGLERAAALTFADNWFRLLRESRFLTEAVPPPAVAAFPSTVPASHSPAAAAA